MASPAHCAFCFETLSASLEKRQPLSLRDVEELWDRYLDPSDDVDVNGDPLDDQEENVDTSPPEEPLRPAAISRLLAPIPRHRSSASTPSTASSTSSLRADTSSSANSKSSSRTSLSSSPLPISRRLRPRKRARSDTEDFPLFVTWNTFDRSGHKSLRGCIGTFQAQPLERGLRDYALTSAFDDTRFMPIATRELFSLDCGVTLLTDFETADDAMDWELGKHGLRISFTYHSRRYGATYLPDVPREQGWTKEETIVSLMRKAGWSGRKDDWTKVANMDVVRYQGRLVSLHHQEWRVWRDWASEHGYGKRHLK